MKSNFFKKILISLFLLTLIFLPQVSRVCSAAVDTGQAYGEELGLGSGGKDIRLIIINIIRVFLGFLALIAVCLILYAGWLWMTSQGEQEKIKRAKDILKNTIIGLIIILSSWAIVSFIFNILSGKINSNNNYSVDDSNTNDSSLVGGRSALGEGIVKSHHPERDQEGVPRNSGILITFKEAMDPATIISDTNRNGTFGDCDAVGVCDLAKTENLQLVQASADTSSSAPVSMVARVSADKKLFILQPQQYIGSPDNETWYKVAVTKDVKKENGDSGFPSAGSDKIGYDWSFQVSNKIDLDAPQVESILPAPGTEESRNMVIQINFNEAVDPIASVGTITSSENPEYNNILVKKINTSTTPPTETVVKGSFYISNQYRTIEFMPDEQCGVNSCGEKMYCLPASSTIAVLVKAATTMEAGKATATFPYNGIVDMAGNSLDGNGNGIAEGPKSQSKKAVFSLNDTIGMNDAARADYIATHGDDYSWNFKIDNTINSTPPKIISTAPAVASSSASLVEPTKIIFDKMLMSRTLNEANITIGPKVVTPSSSISYWISKSNISTSSTAVYINHSPFQDNTAYNVLLTGNIKDVYQNCFTPCSSSGCTGSPSCCQKDSAISPTTSKTCP